MLYPYCAVSRAVTYRWTLSSSPPHLSIDKCNTLHIILAYTCASQVTGIDRFKFKLQTGLNYVCVCLSGTFTYPAVLQNFFKMEGSRPGSGLISDTHSPPSLSILHSLSTAPNSASQDGIDNHWPHQRICFRLH